MERLSSYDASSTAITTAPDNPERDPTEWVCEELTTAFGYFNDRLFNGQLPRCLITLQRHHRVRGYFAESRFKTRDDRVVADEIALNPDTFHERSVAEILSTLVHEQTHLWQAHYGRPGRGGYHHNREWARRMEAIGLIPSDTGLPGGKKIGPRVSHYIKPGGLFSRVCDELLAGGFTLSFIDRWAAQKPVLITGSELNSRQAAQAASKTRFRCPGCGDKAWGKPELQIDCRRCVLPMT